MIGETLANLFDGRNRSIDAVARTFGVNYAIAYDILVSNGYVPDHVGKTSGKLYFRPEFADVVAEPD